MGSVYKAEDMRLTGRICAIKEIQIDPLASPNEKLQMRQQFFQEASILGRLDHPNLPKVSDFFTERNRDYLVMDYIPGIDLREKIKQAREQGACLPERQILDYAAQICSALDYLHCQNPPIIHRDLKPANIKITPDGLIKLVDFGLVKVMTPEDDRTVTVIQGRGTAVYLPLEQYGGDTGHTDPRSDIYSLGATLYHLLTNTPPPEAKSRFLSPTEFTTPRTLNPRITLRTEHAIMWAMAMHPEERPESIRALRDLLLATGSLSLWPALHDQQPLSRIAPINRWIVLIDLILVSVALLISAGN
jgi:serine/threonine-protein kinase